MDLPNRTRPTWRVDLKWIFGIITTLSLGTALLLYGLTNITSEKTAVPITTYIVASQFSRNGLDDPVDIEETKKKFLSTNENVFYPFEGNTEVKITREELQSLSPRELRLKIFTQVVEPYYKEGVESVANRLGKTQEERDKIKNEGSLLGLVNYKTHQIINNIFLVSLIFVTLSSIGLISFSYRYGKLISPAVVMIFDSIIPASFLFILSNAKGSGGPIPFLPTDITQQIAKEIGLPYFYTFFAGIGLLVIALLTKLTRKFTGH